MKPPIWLAIDPGNNKTGFAYFNEAYKLLDVGHLDVEHLDSIHNKRHAIGAGLGALKYYLERQYGDRPIRVICEEPIMQGKANQQMQRLLGVAETFFDHPFHYYNPLTVKATMGSGRFEKPEVAKAVSTYVAMSATEGAQKAYLSAVDKKNWDMTDAIAIGLTHFIKLNLIPKIAKEKKRASQKSKPKKAHSKESAKAHLGRLSRKASAVDLKIQNG